MKHPLRRLRYRARSWAESALWRLFGPQGTLRAIFPAVESRLRQRQEARWDRDWARESRRPVSELSTVVPRELIDAVDSEWIRPGSSILDIGSGRGQISAWLAARGFHVLGVDLSAEATKLAKAHFPGPSDRLEFRTMDICQDRPEAARFDALVDRGCFHVLPPPLRPRYVANVAAWAKEGARFLLLCKVTRTEHLLVQEIRTLFEPYFELVRAKPAAEPHRRSAGPLPRAEAPGAVFWMVRRTARPAGRS